MNQDLVLRRCPGVRQLDLGESAMLFDSERAEMFELNSVGAIVWGNLDGTVTVGELTDDLVAVFPGPEDAVRDSVSAFVADLIRLGLVVRQVPQTG